MISTLLSHFFLAIFLLSRTAKNLSLSQEKNQYALKTLTQSEILQLADMSDLTHMSEILSNICIPRVVGSEGHNTTKNYIKKSMRNLGWTVESDVFEENTPIFGRLSFENIIAKLNPNAKHYLALACHYDSKYFQKDYFVGATDSAVPCAQLINMAKVMKTQFASVKNNDPSLMFIFFDGEEAFEKWNSKDSIYGAKHLARKWDENSYQIGSETITELDKLDMLVLLDLIGAADPKFYNYFAETEKWYASLIEVETQLAQLRKFNNYSYGKPQQRYFQQFSVNAFIEDDHIPFLRRNVPILHLIPSPFPPFWHTPQDNLENVDMNTVENINKILRTFVASYLHIPV